MTPEEICEGIAIEEPERYVDVKVNLSASSLSMNSPKTWWVGLTRGEFGHIQLPVYRTASIEEAEAVCKILEFRLKTIRRLLGIK